MPASFLTIDIIWFYHERQWGCYLDCDNAFLPGLIIINESGATS